MADAGPRTVWNSPIWYDQLGKPWVPLGSQLYGSRQDPPLLPEWLDCCRGTPEHSKSPRSQRRKKWTKQFARHNPSMLAPAPWRLGLDMLPSSHALFSKGTQPYWGRTGSQSGQKDPRETTAHAAGTTAMQQEAWRVSISPVGLQGAPS